MKIGKLNVPIFLFTIAFFLEGLDAFSIFNIPLSWIGVVIYVLIFVYLKISGTRGYVFDLTLIKYFLYYLTLVTIIRAFTFEANMPEYATTSFIEFISLRILKIISFYSIVSLIIHFIKKKNVDYVITLVHMSVFLYLSYLYILIFHIYSILQILQDRGPVQVVGLNQSEERVLF